MSYPSAVSRSDPAQPRATQQRPRVWRWLVVLAVVLCLHWVAAQWVERNRATFTSGNPAHVPVQIALLTPERIERNPDQTAARPAAEPREHAATATVSKPREHVLTSTRSAAASAVAAPAPASAAEAASDAAGAAAAASASVNASAAASAAVAASAPAPAAHAAPGVKFSVPPSGDLQFDTFYNGVRNQPGTIHWSSDGKTYDMVVSVPVPFVGTFSYSSHGHVDAFGLAPDQYIEKRGHRAEDVAIFNRTTRQIAFTKTPATLPLTDGAQDRFSMVMQLASLVRGDPNAYKPGVTRQFFVVDNDSGEIWPIETIGDETIRTQQGYINTRHFMRLPRHAGDQRRIDVWLAPALGWLPARILQTEPNGTEVQLVWSGPLTAPSGNGAGSAAATSSDNPAASQAPGTADAAGTPNPGTTAAPADASAPPATGPADATPASPASPAVPPAPESDPAPASATTPTQP
ncbi:DUF3108 domain-containing protein [Paraburkholderia sp. BCC1885]|uniref:DUF3108 domain-containing protein n=1 Tax=Paraburkholderia sp. BCC1885 TaxID=2562669 RepID=UPI00118249B2|nr:DUF3108 domain-containing protein [Paraburkholderia sp. BCC1885]